MKHAPVTLKGLLGVCDECDSPAIRLIWDRVEVAPLKNFMGLWCRRICPVEPPHRCCQRHMRRERIALLFQTEKEWQAAQREQTGEEWEEEERS